MVIIIKAMLDVGRTAKNMFARRKISPLDTFSVIQYTSQPSDDKQELKGIVVDYHNNMAAIAIILNLFHDRSNKKHVVKRKRIKDSVDEIHMYKGAWIKLCFAFMMLAVKERCSNSKIGLASLGVHFRRKLQRSRMPTTTAVENAHSAFDQLLFQCVLRIILPCVFFDSSFFWTFCTQSPPVKVRCDKKAMAQGPVNHRGPPPKSKRVHAFKFVGRPYPWMKARAYEYECVSHVFRSPWHLIDVAFRTCHTWKKQSLNPSWAHISPVPWDVPYPWVLYCTCVS